MTKFKDYFYGNKISEYGRKNGRVDYRTFARAFDAVLNNDIMSKTWGTCGEWEQESGQIDNSERIEEIEERLQEIESRIDELFEDDTTEADAERAALEAERDKLEEEREELENEQDEQPEVFQWYIVDDNGASICKEFNEIVYYNSELDMYLWGVTHYGTAWDYVLTDITCEIDENAKA